jgi:hypothetical protein
MNAEGPNFPDLSLVFNLVRKVCNRDSQPITKKSRSRNLR